jgi:hypothetical protein
MRRHGGARSPALRARSRGSGPRAGEDDRRSDRGAGHLCELHRPPPGPPRLRAATWTSETASEAVVAAEGQGKAGGIISVMVAIAVHELSLVGDSFLHPASLSDRAARLLLRAVRYDARDHRRLGNDLPRSFLLRSRSDRQRAVEDDPSAHRTGLDRRARSLVHGGTDAGQAWFIALLGITAAPEIVLLGGAGTIAPAPATTPTTAGPSHGLAGYTPTSRGDRILIAGGGLVA